MNVAANSFTAQLPPQSITTFVGSTIITGTESEVFEEDQGIQFFPNPFSGSFEIVYKEPCSYSIHDISGKALKEGRAFGNETFGNELMPGVYFVKINTAKGSKLSKVVKQ